jgi:hypothetical protein
VQEHELCLTPLPMKRIEFEGQQQVEKEGNEEGKGR